VIPLFHPSPGSSRRATNKEPLTPIIPLHYLTGRRFPICLRGRGTNPFPLCQPIQTERAREWGRTAGWLSADSWRRS